MGRWTVLDSGLRGSLGMGWVADVLEAFSGQQTPGRRRAPAQTLILRISPAVNGCRVHRVRRGAVGPGHLAHSPGGGEQDASPPWMAGGGEQGGRRPQVRDEEPSSERVSPGLKVLDPPATILGDVGP